jgi:hypothetical protein
MPNRISFSTICPVRALDESATTRSVGTDLGSEEDNPRRARDMGGFGVKTMS